MTTVPKPALAQTSPGPHRAVHIAAIADDMTRQIAKAVGAQLGWTRFDIHEGGAQTALSLMEGSLNPDLLLVDISESQDPIAAMTAVAEVCSAETKVVALGMLNDIDLYRCLLGMGVSEYLVKPISRDSLSKALQNATRAKGDASEPATSAKLIAMIGSRGGVGVTTLAVSSAWALSQRQSVVLLDLDLQFGNAALSLDLTNGRGLREMLANPDRVDELLLASAMTRAGDNLRLLGTEEALRESSGFASAGLAALLAEVRPSVDYIVVDLPRTLDPLSREVLDGADVIAVVTDQSLAGMRDTHRLLGLLSGSSDDTKCLVIANRVGGVAGEVGRADFERGIEGKISISIPVDVKAAVASAQLGKAFGDVARSPRTVAELQALALAFSGSEATAKGPSLMSRVLRK